jgi:hypothetical protein
MRSLLLCICFPIAVFSQDIRFGAKGGLNLSDVVLNNVVNPDLEAEYRTKLGPHAGFFLRVEFDELWSFAPELLYSQKGVIAVDTKIHLNYVTIPLLVKYAVSDNFRVEGGPEIGYLFLAKSRYGKVNDVCSNSLDIAANVGIEYLISEKLFLGVRLGAGFSNLVDDNSGSGIKYQNRVLQFSIGYEMGKVAR